MFHSEVGIGHINFVNFVLFCTSVVVLQNQSLPLLLPFRYKK